MEQEEILRQEAIRLHLQGVSVKMIGEQVNRTRQWVYKWLNEFKGGSSDWYRWRSWAIARRAEMMRARVLCSFSSFRGKATSVFSCATRQSTPRAR